MTPDRTFERNARYAILLVFTIAMIVSFGALTWVGQHMRLTWSAPLIPLVIDGFGAACSVGIVRSQAAGQPFRHRFSEWVGLTFAVAVSVLGNVYHVLNVMPPWLKVVVAASIPIIVPYGMHIYGRAVTRSAPQDSQHKEERPVETESAPEPPRPAPRRAPVVPIKDRARSLYDTARSPGEKPNAQTIHDALQAFDGAPKRASTTRKWVAAWWESDPYNPENAPAISAA